MPVTIEDAGSCRKKLLISVPKQQVQAKLQENYTELQQTVTVPGFRAGKAPITLLKKKYGDTVNQTAKESLIEEGLKDAIQESKLQVFGNTKLEGIAFDPENELSFTAFCYVKPEIKLENYKGVEVEIAQPNVKEEDVAEAVQRMRLNKGQLVPAPDGAKVEDPDHAISHVRGSVDGESIFDVEEFRLMKSNDIIEGIHAHGLWEKILGKKSGDKIEYKTKIDHGHYFEKYPNKEAVLNIEILDIKRPEPAPLEDILKEHDVENEEELKTQVRKQIENEVTHYYERAIEEMALDKLMKNLEITLPEDLVSQEIENVIARKTMEMQNHGLSEEKIHEETHKLRDNQKEAVTRSFKSFFVLDEISRKEKIFVTEDEVDGHLTRIAGMYGVDLDQIKQHYLQTGQLSQLRNSIKENKVLALLREKAVLKEPAKKEKADKKDKKDK